MNTTLNAAIDAIFAGLACEVMREHIERLDRIAARVEQEEKERKSHDWPDVTTSRSAVFAPAGE